jgi:transcriptional regulator with XRE-family HTH domain
MHPQLSMTEVCQRLRAIRQAQSLSLADVEALSGGALKAVVLGSYERGSRTLSVKRALYIASLYNIPAVELFSEKVEASASHPLGAIDLRALRNRLRDQGESETLLTRCARYLGEIQKRRGDWNGEVMSIRSSDFDFLAISNGTQVSVLTQWLISERLFFKKER